MCLGNLVGMSNNLLHYYTAHHRNILLQGSCRNLVGSSSNLRHCYIVHRRKKAEGMFHNLASSSNNPHRCYIGRPHSILSLGNYHNHWGTIHMIHRFDIHTQHFHILYNYRNLVGTLNRLHHCYIVHRRNILSQDNYRNLVGTIHMIHRYYIVRPRIQGCV